MNEHFGETDIFGRTIIYEYPFRDRKDKKDFRILLTNDAQLLLIASTPSGAFGSFQLVNVITLQKPGLIFSHYHTFGGFSFKGGGKRYGYGKLISWMGWYKFDFDNYGNLWIRYQCETHMNSGAGNTTIKYESEPQLFINRLKILVIKTLRKKRMYNEM